MPSKLCSGFDFPRGCWWTHDSWSVAVNTAISGRGFNDATCSVYATTFLPLMIGVTWLYKDFYGSGLNAWVYSIEDVDTEDIACMEDFVAYTCESGDQIWPDEGELRFCLSTWGQPIINMLWPCRRNLVSVIQLWIWLKTRCWFNDPHPDDESMDSINNNSTKACRPNHYRGRKKDASIQIGKLWHQDKGNAWTCGMSGYHLLIWIRSKLMTNRCAQT